MSAYAFTLGELTTFDYIISDQCHTIPSLEYEWKLNVSFLFLLLLAIFLQKEVILHSFFLRFR